MNSDNRIVLVASWMAFVIPLFLLLAIFGFIIYPIVPDELSALDHLVMIKSYPIKAFIILDPIVIVIPILLITIYFSFYVLFNSTYKNISLLALILGLLSVVLFIPSRPLIELFSLSDLYQNAMVEETRNYYISSFETLLRNYHGTSWLLGNIFSAFSLLIYSILMFKSNIVKRSTSVLSTPI